MNPKDIIEKNKEYWNKYADFWFGTTSLPTYGVHFVTEDDLHLFENVKDKKVLEICCGSGHSLKYLADRGAGELWGLDASQKQLENAEKYLSENSVKAKLICAPMEADSDIPVNYFDYVYSVYGIGWTTDLDGTFAKIASYLKKDGTFIFSWHHTLHYCVGFDIETRQTVTDGDKLVFGRSYFDESYFKMPVHDGEVTLSNRKISTYVNALAKAGFAIELMIEQTDSETLSQREQLGAKAKKAQMLPISVLFKARKL